MNEQLKQIGARIKDARKQKGLNQGELAKLLEKSLRTIQKYEKGEIDLSIANINQLSEALDLTPAFLLGYETDDVQINSFADILDFLFKLDDKDGLNYSINIDKSDIDGDWTCAISFNGQDNKADSNTDMCLMLEEFQNYKEKFESHWIPRTTYDEWRNRVHAYYASMPLKNKQADKTDTKATAKKHNAQPKEK